MTGIITRIMYGILPMLDTETEAEIRLFIAEKEEMLKKRFCTKYYIL